MGLATREITKYIFRRLISIKTRKEDSYAGNTGGFSDSSGKTKPEKNKNRRAVTPVASLNAGPATPS